MRRRLSPRRLTAFYLAAGAAAGALAGLACGIYLVVSNPVAGLGARHALVLAPVALYALLLAVPIALALSMLDAFKARRRRLGGRPGQELGELVGRGVFLVGLAMLLRALYLIAQFLLSGSPLLLSLRQSAPVLAAALAAFLAAWAISAVWTAWARYFGLRRASLALLCLAVLAAVAAAVLSGPEPRRLAGQASAVSFEPVDRVTVQAPSRRVALIGFDGLDPHLLDRLIAAGEMPSFSRLRSEGLYSPLETLPSGLSPPIWTTLATGVAPEVHGILDFVIRHFAWTGLDLSAIKRYPVGLGTRTLFDLLERTPLVEEKLITPLDRAAPAIWTLSSLAGVPACVVDWMGSWPSEPVGGTLISDRAFFAWNLGSLFLGAGETRAERLPQRLELPGRSSAGTAEMAGLCSPEPDCVALLPARSGQRIDPADSAAFHLAEDAFYLDVTRRLLAAERCDLFVYYSHLPDFINHGLTPEELERLLAGEPPAAGSDMERLAHEVYAQVDRTLGELLALLGEEVAVLVVSDHGVEIAEPFGRRVVTHGTGPPGVFFFRPSSRRLAAPRPLQALPSVYDIAPTSLALLGLPITSAMRHSGRILTEVLDAELPPPRIARVVDAAAVPPSLAAETAAGEDSELEAELRERLKSLGYIQ